MRFTANIRRSWKDGGLKVVLSRAIRRAIRPVCRTGSLVFIECYLPSMKKERRDVPGILVREAKRADAHLFEDQKTFLDRMNAGHRCFMGIEEATGKLTNYRWVCTSAAHIPELEQYMMLEPWEAYAYDLNTLPEFRRRGIDAFTRHWIYSHLRDSGFTKVYAYIHGDNQPSLKASRNLLRPIGRVWFFQFRGLPTMSIGTRRIGLPEFRSAVELAGTQAGPQKSAI